VFVIAIVIIVVVVFIAAVAVAAEEGAFIGGGGGGSKIGCGDVESDSGHRRYAEDRRSVRPIDRMMELIRCRHDTNTGMLYHDSSSINF
jgi:hypothetical protein